MRMTYYKPQIQLFSPSYVNLLHAKNSWKTGQSKHNTDCDIRVKMYAEVKYDKGKVANKFNQFFSSISKRLVDKLPLSKGVYGIEFVNSFYLNKGVLPNSFAFNEVTVDEITKMLEDLQVTKAWVR